MSIDYKKVAERLAEILVKCEDEGTMCQDDICPFYNDKEVCHDSKVYLNSLCEGPDFTKKLIQKLHEEEEE